MTTEAQKPKKLSELSIDDLVLLYGTEGAAYEHRKAIYDELDRRGIKLKEAPKQETISVSSATWDSVKGRIETHARGLAEAIKELGDPRAFAQIGADAGGRIGIVVSAAKLPKLYGDTRHSTTRLTKGYAPLPRRLCDNANMQFSSVWVPDSSTHRENVSNGDAVLSMEKE